MTIPASTNLKNWKVGQLPDLAGKTYFITGGNSGIGYEAALHLRRANGNVIIGSRSTDKGTAAISSLKETAGPGTVQMVQIDLADSGSIRAANTSLRQLTDGLDAMINNAGIMQTPQLQTVDGFEMQFGTNHLGHFLLNQLVFDLVAARSGRIVPVSSIAHLRAKMNFEDVMLTNNYSASTAYTQSKLANILYGLELARRLEAIDSSVLSVTAHPGYSNTNLQSTGPTGMWKRIYRVSNALMAQSASDGAVPIVLAAAGSEAKNGAYYGPTKFGDWRGPVGDSTIAKGAQDEAAATKLWSLSQQLLDITFEVS